MAKLILVEPSNSLRVYLKYDDKLSGEIDLAKAIKRNSFSELYDSEEFSKVYIDEFTNELCWPSGVRMCTNALHKQLSLLELMHRLRIDINNE